MTVPVEATRQDPRQWISSWDESHFDGISEAPEMNMSTDFFAKRLAAIEEEKARRAAAMEEEQAAQAYAHRLNQQIPLIVDCIEKMGLAGLSREEIADLFRHAADELEKPEEVGA